MLKIFIAFLFGVVVATVGFNGVANIADKQLNNAQQFIKENAK